MERLVPVVLAVLAVLAFGAAAATIDTATDEGVAGDSEGSGFGGPRFSLGAINDSAAGGGNFQLPPWLADLLLALVVVLGVVGFAAYVYQEGLSGLAKLAMAVVIFTAVVSGLLYLFDNVDFPSDGQGGLIGGGPPSFGTGGESGGSAVPSLFQDPSFVMFLVLGALVVGSLLVLARSTGSGSAPEVDAPRPPEPSASVAGVGEAAGRAADRIESDVALDNAVYRAWHEMTNHLDLPRETTTPGEFADAAVDAGMGRNDVRELTALFEQARYGGIEPGEATEARAVTALRNIETAYADADADDAGEFDVPAADDEHEPTGTDGAPDA
jgi:hypothetical protein